MDIPDRRQKVTRPRRLHEIAVGTRRQSAEKVVCVLLDRQHHNLQPRQLFGKLAHARDAVHPR